MPLLRDTYAISGATILEAKGPMVADWTNYVSDLKLLFQHSSLASDEWLHRPLLMRFGDNVEFALYPVLSKTRAIGDQNAILLPLNMERHFGPAFQHVVEENSPNDFPFEDKIAKVGRINETQTAFHPDLHFYFRYFGVEPRLTLGGTH